MAHTKKQCMERYADDALMEILRDSDCSPSARVQAARLVYQVLGVLDKNQITEEKPLSELTASELDALLRSGIN